MRPACGECTRAEQDAYGFDNVAVVPMGAPVTAGGLVRCERCRLVPSRYYLVDFRHSPWVVA